MGSYRGWRPWTLSRYGMNGGCLSLMEHLKVEHIGLNAVGVIEQFRAVCRAVTITARTAEHGWTERGTAMRLIDASVLQEEYKKRHDGKRLLLIDVAPTVDAVPVVKCRYCKNVQHDTIFREYWCRGREVDPDGYCSDGE